MLGHVHVPHELVPRLDAFLRDSLCPLLNFHRPCAPGDVDSCCATQRQARSHRPTVHRTGAGARSAGTARKATRILRYSRTDVSRGILGVGGPLATPESESGAVPRAKNRRFWS